MVKNLILLITVGGSLCNMPSFGQHMGFFAQYSNPIIPMCFLGMDPACGEDDKTYVNECVMILMGQKKKFDGWCPT